jgi:hypothetical protein
VCLHTVQASLRSTELEGTEVGVQRHERGYEDRDGDAVCRTQRQGKQTVPLEVPVYAPSLWKGLFTEVPRRLDHLGVPRYRECKVGGE